MRDAQADLDAALADLAARQTREQTELDTLVEQRRKARDEADRQAQALKVQREELSAVQRAATAARYPETKARAEADRIAQIAVSGAKDKARNAAEATEATAREEATRIRRRPTEGGTNHRQKQPPDR